MSFALVKDFVGKESFVFNIPATLVILIRWKLRNPLEFVDI